MEEEAGPSKKCLQKSKCVTEGQERHEQPNARVTEVDSDNSHYISRNMFLKRLIFYFSNM
jgi:hypothetical protein